MARPAAITALVLTALVAAAPAALAQSATLRWKLAEGDQLQWKFRQVTDTETGVLGSDKPLVKLSIDMTVGASWNVEAVENDTFKIRQTIDSIALRMTAPPSDPVLYNSASPDPPGSAAAEELAEQLKPLVGAQITLRMTERGEVQEADVPEPLLQSLGGQQPDSLKQILAGALLTLPEQAADEGDQWRDQTTVPVRLGQLTIDRTYTLGEAEEGGHEIELDGKLSLEPAPRDDSTLVRFRSQRLGGRYLFDAKRGHLRSAEVNQTTATDTTYRDSRVAVRARTKLTAESQRASR